MRSNVLWRPRKFISWQHHTLAGRAAHCIGRPFRVQPIYRTNSRKSAASCVRTQVLQSGYDIRTVQELLGHADVKTTMIYIHVLKVGGGGVISPLDRM